MTYFYYKTNTWNSQPPKPTQDQVEIWKHLANKSNWRIVQLPNGFYQTEHKDINCNCDPKGDSCCDNWLDVTRRETIESAEAAIDGSVEHYANKVEFIKGPKVVKTFE